MRGINMRGINMYKMKGCSKSKTKTKTKTRKNKKLFSGGSSDLRLAYPSAGPPRIGYNFLNPQTGGCNGQCSVMTGGKKSHTQGCDCSCKTCHKSGCNGECSLKKGGKKSHASKFTCKKGGASLPYPNGLLGNAWTPAISGWPGIDGISMDRNHLGYNTYNNDVSRQMRDVGANPPFTYLKGGKTKRTKKKRKSKTQKGGVPFFGQDLINVSRQMQFGVGSAYNGIRGYTSPVNPLPWKDQYKQDM